MQKFNFLFERLRARYIVNRIFFGADCLLRHVRVIHKYINDTPSFII